MRPTPDMIPALERRGCPERTVRAAITAVETDATRALSGSRESLVVLSGTAGVGKSVSAMLWLLDQARGKPECLRWVQSGDLARGYAYDPDAFDALTGVYALAIDDLGEEYVDDKGRWMTTLSEVLNRRFARMKRTVLTTNIVDTDAFASRYGERIASRLNEDGAFLVVGGDDLRRVKVTVGESPAWETESCDEPVRPEIAEMKASLVDHVSVRRSRPPTEPRKSPAHAQVRSAHKGEP